MVYIKVMCPRMNNWVYTFGKENTIHPRINFKLGNYNRGSNIV